MKKRISRVLKTRYFKKRHWKITWTAVFLPGCRLRLLKFYEHRDRIGAPWTLERYAVQERAL